MFSMKFGTRSGRGGGSDTYLNFGCIINSLLIHFSIYYSNININYSLYHQLLLIDILGCEIIAAFKKKKISRKKS